MNKQAFMASMFQIVDLWTEEITAEELVAVKMGNTLMTDDLNPSVLSHHLWAFLQHCLSGVGRQTFKNTARQDGFNVWRKLTMDINSRTDCVRHTLRNRCQQFPQVSSNDSVWKALADWESLYTEYLEAGGSPMDFEDRRGQVLRILPKSLRRDVFRKLQEFKTVASLKEWIREQLEYEKEWDAADRSTTGPRTKVVGALEASDDRDEPDSEDFETLIAMAAEATPEELLAIQKKFQKFTKRPPFKPREENSRAPRSGPPGRTEREPRCSNCSKTGHTAMTCRGPKRLGTERTCFNCGEAGHIAAKCTKGKQDLKMLEPRGRDPGATISFGCVEVVKGGDGGLRAPPDETEQTFHDFDDFEHGRTCHFHDFLPGRSCQRSSRGGEFWSLGCMERPD